MTLKYINSNYNNFILPNLNCLEFINSKLDILKSLELLFTLENICSRIIHLDLSNIRFTDEGILKLTQNIVVFKKIEQIDLSNINLAKNKKSFIQLEQKKIKIRLIQGNKNKYKILLGGSTISGKTTYFNSFFTKEFGLSTTIPEHNIIKKLHNVEFEPLDCFRWGGRFDNLVSKLIETSDAVILLFDISNNYDFSNLYSLVEMIKEYHKLEDFPVLLIGNKSDLDNKVRREEIDKFLEKEKFIGYFEVSCKYHINVEESVNFMVNYIYNKELKSYYWKKSLNIDNKK